MKKLSSIFFILVLSLGVMSCASSRKVDFYGGGETIPVYITITDFTSEEIGIKIEVYGRPDYLYHVILNEEGERMSEGWFWTRVANTRDYTVSMKAKKGFNFERGKPYHLCIGFQNPDLVEFSTNKYQCSIYQEFRLGEGE